MTQTVYDVPVHGIDVDRETRCQHYHSERDIVALRFVCCDRWYPCYECHAALADHPAQPWPAARADEPAVLCGNCGTQMSPNQYLASHHKCPVCEAAFNPGCANHRDLYFECEAAYDARHPRIDLGPSILEASQLTESWGEFQTLQQLQLLQHTLGGTFDWEPSDEMWANFDSRLGASAILRADIPLAFVLNGDRDPALKVCLVESSVVVVDAPSFYEEDFCILGDAEGTLRLIDLDSAFSPEKLNLREFSLESLWFLTI